MKGFDDSKQAETAMNLAIGRIFRLGSRPFQPGDIEQYEAAKDMILDVAEYFGITAIDKRPNYAASYSKMHHD